MASLGGSLRYVPNNSDLKLRATVVSGGDQSVPFHYAWSCQLPPADSGNSQSNGCGFNVSQLLDDLPVLSIPAQLLPNTSVWTVVVFQGGEN